MKTSVKTKVLYLTLCIVLFSCKDSTDKKAPFKNEDTIDKIVILFFPSFHENSLMLLDFVDRQQTFRRIGTKNFFREIAPKKFIEIQGPKGMNFQIDSLSYSYLKDIPFNEEDFIDKVNLDYLDGIGHSILYIFKSGRIEDADLGNSLTENEYKLLIKLIDLSIEQSTDSLTTQYLKDLRKYHRNPN